MAAVAPEGVRRASAIAPVRGPAGEFERIDPASGTVASRAPSCRAREAVAAANAAARAFASWSATPPQERRRILMRAAALIETRAAEIGETMRAEIGATDLWLRFNIEVGRQHLEEAAAMVTSVTGTATQGPDGLSFAFREPVGVCLAMAPWNAPFVLGMRSVATALACGNTVVLKASEICPATHLLIGAVFAGAGLPDGVLNVVTHAPEHAAEVVGALISHDAVRRVNFTGSTRVGRIVAETASRHLKRCLLELGGKTPFVVLEDADLDAAADAAAFGAFFNQGQLCISTDRVVVLEPVADAFVEKLAARAARLRAGDPRTGAWPLGPVVSTAVARRLAELVQDAVAKGARLRAGGPADNTFMDATVVDHLAPGMALYTEECFGPVAGICRVATEDEAVSIANDTQYGLSAAVFSRDVGRALAVSRRIESGICHINAPSVSDRPDVPFGGLKDSGYGRFGGPAALDEFTELRWVTVAAGGREYPFLQQDP
ncbi:aldehyde dehydrogenase family protein [Pseudochelatococcus lubricantis]|uniref:aldehyde dehydrogenase family protein n=1 Tax=Pseudochelatococcus lubricantis TaxID=1538102 RepID=UPI0035E78C80